ncbi:hypothetical protein LTR64_000527 [Lithohypha guttulata]|uniref:uncharacterized protein n=1 Tax=Lithohypha guttulata TaxID=1690604 RepID=UPI002DDF82AB|nr:hypothetical protein LTR51_005706 [Lithohypha guttulata]
MEPVKEESANLDVNAFNQNSQTASDYITEQLALEADAKEILPYKFDKCTQALGPLRQSIFACLTCSPPPASPAQAYAPAGLCYGCSISCHGDHNLVELFKRRNFVCDCGTTRTPDSSPCILRVDSATGERGVKAQEPAKGNTYNHNYQNHFCGCGEEYNPDTEKGTMFQCVGLGSVESGGCGEDWWHPECLMGLPRDWLAKGLSRPREEKKPEANNEEVEPEHPVPDGFPEDDDFSALICYKCVEANPWIQRYAGTDGFLPPVLRRDAQASGTTQVAATASLKRKASDEDMPRSTSPSKRLRDERLPEALKGESNTATLEAEDTTLNTNTTADVLGPPSTTLESRHKHDSLPPAPAGTFSILCKEDFRDRFCHCPQCFPDLIPHPQLQEEEDEYEPSISDTAESVAGGGSGTRSVGTGSLLDRGEAALNTMDRVKAIEGVMVYNHLKDKVKEFLKPYAESGEAVSAEDIKSYFEKLRGDQEAVKEASQKPVAGDGVDGDSRREQGGY